MVYLVLLLNIVLLVFGQMLWKLGLEKFGGLSLNNVVVVVASPLILLGIVVYGFATVIWLFVLSRLPLSVAYPLQSFAYVLALIVALYIFNESIPSNRWIGSIIILVGIIVVSYR